MAPETELIGTMGAATTIQPFREAEAIVGEAARSFGPWVRVEPSRHVWEYREPGRRFRILAVVEADDGGLFVSYTPSLPGAASQGKTPEQALSSLCEAAAGCVEAYLQAGEEVPWVQDATFGGQQAVVVKWVDIDV